MKLPDLANRYVFVGSTVIALLAIPGSAVGGPGPVDGPWLAQYWTYIVGVIALIVAFLALVKSVIRSYNWLKDEIKGVITESMGSRMDSHERDELAHQLQTRDALEHLGTKVDGLSDRMSRLEGRTE